VIEDVKALQRRRRAEKAVSKYPKSAVFALKAIFDEYDRDGSGDIDRQELTFALQRRMQGAHRVETRSKTLVERQAEAGRVNGQPGDTKGIFLVDFSDTLFDALDANGDAKVEFGELLRIIYPLATTLEHRTMLSWVSPTKTADEEEEEYRLLEEQKRLASLRAMFSAFDRNKDGKVSLAEFRMAMLDHKNWEEVDNLFDQYDANGNGEVDFEEFCAIVDPDPDAEPVDH